MFGAGADVFAVWGYVIANAVNGSVELNPALLAAVLGMTAAEVVAAIEKLASPDIKSRSPAEDGRRIMAESGFQYAVINHGTYRAIKNEDDRRAYNREAKRRERAKSSDVKRVVIDKDEMSNMSAHTEAEADTEAEKIKTLPQSTPRPSPKASLRKERSATVAPPDFVIFWNAYPRRTGKGAALKAWTKHNPTLSAVLKALAWQTRQPAWTKDRGQFIPHPATWLNRQGWDDEPFETPAAKRPAVDWQDECAIIHGGACKSRYLHELMAQPEQDVK